MPSYFRQVPDFDYVNRNPKENNISEYITVKNLFKRGKIRDDIFESVVFFEKYQIIGDERPDNVAYQYYDDESLDWLVLLSNNIVNVQTEWPIPQQSFENYLLDKYGSYESLNSVGDTGDAFYPPHHFETNVDVKNSLGVTIIPKGIRVGYRVEYKIINDVAKKVAVPYFTTETSRYVAQNGVTTLVVGYSYYDSGLETEVVIPIGDFVVPVTNYEYEEKIEDEKRNIFLLKNQYLNIVLNDMNDIMPYKKGSKQYVSRTLKKGDNIKLFE